MLDADTTLRDLATHVPGATGVLQDFRLDFCCGGGKTLRAACAEGEIPVDAVLTRLEQAAAPDAGHGDEAQWERFTLEDLVKHVLDAYHTFTREKLESLPRLMAKVVVAHGSHDPTVPEMADRLAALRAELEPHMQKEERILFPHAVALSRAAEKGAPAPKPLFGSVSNPIRVMEMDHDETGRTLHALRTAARDYVAPEEACPTYRALLAGLDELDRDLRLHIHFEKNILFPRMLELEQRAARA